MAKMFYTLEEVCEKLDKPEDAVKEMVRTGQIQEFRDRDKLMFKVEQVDLLASGEEDTSDVHLELDDSSASGSGTGVALKDDSAIGLEESREGTGVSVFDTDHGGEDTGAALAEVGDEEEDLGLDAVGSGSGLLDLTRESDDTSLGAELLEEVYQSEEAVEIPAHASGLFEAAAEKPGEEMAAPPGAAAMPVLIEAYDGSGSGLGAGLLIGALAALVCVAIVGIVGVGGATSVLATKIASSSNSVMMWAGGLLGVTIILGLIGLFIGKASE
ncbi:MAG: helix-turn-helix domain-containing protein [Planctomycetota bacterium]|jgi:hypothetical protein